MVPAARSLWSSTPYGSRTRPPTRCRSPRSRKWPSSTNAAARKSCTGSRSAPSQVRLVALVGSSGAGKSTMAQLLPRLYDVDGGSVRLGGVDVRDLAFDTLRDTLGWSPRTATCSTSRSGPTCRWRDRRRPMRSCGTCCAGRDWPISSLVAGRARHGGGRARLSTVRRRAAAADDRPAAARPSARCHPRRGDGSPGLDVGGRGSGGIDRGAGRAYGRGDRASPVDRSRRRPDTRDRGRSRRRARHAR